MKNSITIAIAGVVAVGLFFGGWKVRDWQADAADLARLEAEKKTTALLIQLAEDVASRTEVAIGDIRVENKTIHQKAVHEIKTNTIYADCVLPDSGRLRANEARSAANASIGSVRANAATP